MNNTIDTIKSYQQAAWSEENQAKVTQIYQSLNLEEGSQLAVHALELLDKQKIRHAEEILLNISCFTPGALKGLYQELIKRQFLYPGIIYREAGTEISNQLVAWEPDTSLEANHLLIALAWIGDEVVQQKFTQWRKAIPDWATELFVPPDAYAQQAGWVLTPGGNRRNLFHTHCYPLVRSGDDADYQNSPVKVAEGDENHCMWCNRQLTSLFDIDLADPALKFLQLDGTQLRIVTCDICTTYGYVYTNVDWHGAAKWYLKNQKPDYLPDDSAHYDTIPPKRLVFSQHSRNPFQAAHQLIPISSSQIGGHPNWIQDAEYPICPECNELMNFIAQLDMENFEEYGEGVFYAFLCKNCYIACTSYQQT
jgi:hypothetical protein